MTCHLPSNSPAIQSSGEGHANFNSRTVLYPMCIPCAHLRLPSRGARSAGAKPPIAGQGFKRGAIIVAFPRCRAAGAGNAPSVHRGPRHNVFSEVETEHTLVKDAQPGRASTGPGGILNETHEPSAVYGVERNSVEGRIIPGAWWQAGAGPQGDWRNQAVSLGPPDPGRLQWANSGTARNPAAGCAGRVAGAVECYRCVGLVACPEGISQQRQGAPPDLRQISTQDLSGHYNI